MFDLLSQLWSVIFRKLFLQLLQLLSCLIKCLLFLRQSFSNRITFFNDLSKLYIKLLNFLLVFYLILWVIGDLTF